MSKLALGGVIIFGLIGALSLSYNTIIGDEPCPNIWIVPACYIVSIAYFLMLIAFLNLNKAFSPKLFYIGISIALFFALPATLVEIFKGNICPALSNGLPLCYVSFALCCLITLLWLITTKYTE